MRTRTIILGSAGAIGLTILSVVLFPDDVMPLVENISRGQPSEAEAQVLVDEAMERATQGPTGNTPTPGRIDPLIGEGGSSSGTDEPYQAPPPLRVEPLSAHARPFIGTWRQTSTSGELRLVVTVTLHDDARYDAIAAIYPPGGEQPSRTIRSGGVWSHTGSGVVLSRVESDDPAYFPTGWREVYWDSVIQDGVWVYHDADDLERRLERHTSTVKRP